MPSGPLLGHNFQGVKHGVVDALEAALALGDNTKADELFAYIDAIPPAQLSPYLATQTQRMRARRDGDAAGLDAAARRFADIEIPFWRAVALLELAELTGDDSPRAEARATFERLRATPWVERAAGARRAEVVA